MCNLNLELSALYYNITITNLKEYATALQYFFTKY